MMHPMAFCIVLWVGIAVPIFADGDSSQPIVAESAATEHQAIPEPAFPLHISGNHRYILDRNETPFLIVGDAPQTLISNLSLAESAAFMEDRRRYGINALWINALCNWAEICRKDGATRDGIVPFLVGEDLSTPNPAYFDRIAAVIGQAAANGMVVFLDPIETSGWLDTLRANGLAKAYAFGQFLGKRYASLPNIVWMHGNDFQTWRNKADDALVQAVARGIRATDSGHLHTVELNYLSSGSLDDPSWAPLIDLDAAYTYFPTYAQVLTEYDKAQFKPVFLVEAAYESEHIPRTDGGSLTNLRKQEYWTMLSGSTGQFYASAASWRLEPGWQSQLDSPGVAQLLSMKSLFAPRRWYDLVPDQRHAVVTSGYSSLSRRAGYFARMMGDRTGIALRLFDLIKRDTGWGSVTTNSYVTAAATEDGSLAIAYIPSSRAVTVDMSKLRGPVQAQWYDPVTGLYHRISGAPFANTGERKFVTPGRNAAGDEDWVLVLEHQAGC